MLIVRRSNCINTASGIVFSVSDRPVRCADAHVFSSITFFLSSESRAVCEITWKNIVQPRSPQMTWRMRIAYWIPMDTNTQSEYVILTALPPQQLLHERASLLRYTGVLICFWSGQEGNKLLSLHFMELGGLLPHSQVSTTCPYPSQISSFLCPSHF